MFQRLHVRNISSSILSLQGKNSKINITKVPKLNEADLEEKFVRGDGPGGQAVATTNNCVVMTHKPTGIVIRCHVTRSLSDNRREARRLLINKLDDLYNLEDSVSAQQKRVEKLKQNKSHGKRDKLEKLKEQWKKNQDV